MLTGLPSLTVTDSVGWEISAAEEGDVKIADIMEATNLCVTVFMVGFIRVKYVIALSQHT